MKESTVNITSALRLTQSNFRMKESLTLNFRLNNLNSGWRTPLQLFCSWLATSPCCSSITTSTSSSSPHWQILELSALCWLLFKDHSRSLPRHYIELGSCAPLGTWASTAGTMTCSMVPWLCPSTNWWEKVLSEETFSSKFPRMPRPLDTNVIAISKSLCQPVSNLRLLYRAVQGHCKIKYSLNTKAVSVPRSDTSLTFWSDFRHLCSLLHRLSQQIFPIYESLASELLVLCSHHCKLRWSLDRWKCICIPAEL